MKSSTLMSGLFAGMIVLLCGCTKEEVKPEQPQQPQAAPGLPKLVINEFMASNQSSIQDEEGKYEDWIEIYNAGEQAIDLGGLYISDDKKNKNKFRIPTTEPAKTTIQPGGYLIFWADNNPEDGPLHVDIKLSAEGEDLGLYAADGKTIDETTFGVQVTDVSAGRLAKGTGAWATFTQPTPGTANPDFQ
jgi:hypothetical protein